MPVLVLQAPNMYGQIFKIGKIFIENSEFSEGVLIEKHHNNALAMAEHMHECLQDMVDGVWELRKQDILVHLTASFAHTSTLTLSNVLDINNQMNSSLSE